MTVTVCVAAGATMGKDPRNFEPKAPAGLSPTHVEFAWGDFLKIFLKGEPTF